MGEENGPGPALRQRGGDARSRGSHMVAAQPRGLAASLLRPSAHRRIERGRERQPGAVRRGGRGSGNTSPAGGGQSRLRGAVWLHIYLVGDGQESRPDAWEFPNPTLQRSGG